jgi:hypothetical protein
MDTSIPELLPFGFLIARNARPLKALCRHAQFHSRFKGHIHFKLEDSAITPPASLNIPMDGRYNALRPLEICRMGLDPEGSETIFGRLDSQHIGR